MKQKWNFFKKRSKNNIKRTGKCIDGPLTPDELHKTLKCQITNHPDLMDSQLNSINIFGKFYLLLLRVITEIKITSTILTHRLRTQPV